MKNVVALRESVPPFSGAQENVTALRHPRPLNIVQANPSRPCWPEPKAKNCLAVKTAALDLPEKCAAAVDLGDPNGRGPGMFGINWKRYTEREGTRKNRVVCIVVEPGDLYLSVHCPDFNSFPVEPDSRERVPAEVQCCEKKEKTQEEFPRAANDTGRDRQKMTPKNARLGGGRYKG